MENKFRKDTTINISKPMKETLDAFLSAKIKRNIWLEEAIREKIYRETTRENPVSERNNPLNGDAQY